MRPITVAVGPLATAVANNIALSQTPSAGPLTLNGALVTSNVAVLDVARRVLFTFAGTETSNTFVVTGTGATGRVQSESLTGTAPGTLSTVLDYKTVTSITISGNAAGAMTVGTSGVAASPWIRLDDWANPNVGIQCTVVGTVNYTVQQSFDDPNAPTNPVGLSSMTWVSSGDSNVVSATGTKASSFTYAPAFIRVLLNSGTGSVTMTATQYGVVPK